MKSDDDTIDLALRQSFADQFFAPPAQQFDVTVAAATHMGLVRSANEDHYAVLRRVRRREVLLTSLDCRELKLTDDEDLSLVVADGMGGAAFGEFASRLAIQTMVELGGRATSWVMKFTGMEAQEVVERADAYMQEIQRRFRSFCQTNPRLTGMGTTWTSAHLLQPHAIIFNIGDSRAYLFRDGRLTQLTRDQTVAQEMIDAGMPADDVVRFRHLLTNSLGGDGGTTPPEVLQFEMRAGDRLLLCSDGLSDMVVDDTIADILKEGDAQQACDQLIESALSAGGKDNVTVVLGDIVAQQARSELVN